MTGYIASTPVWQETWERFFKQGNVQIRAAKWRAPNGHTEGESEVTQSCPTLCDPVDCSLSGSSIHGIFQARVLEWIAISLSKGSSQPRNWTRVSCIAGRRFTVWIPLKDNWLPKLKILMVFCGIYNIEVKFVAIIAKSIGEETEYPGQNTGVGSLSLLQEIFSTQELNPGLLHCRWILYQLSHKGSPKRLYYIWVGVI